MSWKEFVKNLGFKEGLVAGAMFATLSLVGSWLWAMREEVQLLNVMTAFGTVGAVVVAVSVDWRHRILERRKAIIRAKLLAPKLSIRLVGVKTDLKTMLGCWSASANPFDDPVVREEAASWADRRLGLFEMKDVEIIASGSEECATRLSTSLTYLEIFADMLRRVSESHERVKTMREKALKYAECAYRELDLASKECAQWQHWK